MFILDLLKRRHSEKIAEWQREKDEFFRDHCYYYGDYDRDNPHPTVQILRTFQIIMVAIGIIGLTTCLFLAIKSGIDHDIEIGNATKEGATCRMFNLNDHVIVKSGDYENLTGIIIGGCEKGQKYEVKIDSNQKANIDNDGEGIIDVGGRNASVWSYEDLVIIK